MKKINICTLFKDSVMWYGSFIGQVHRFFHQISQQQQTNWKLGKICCLVSPSKDNTYEEVVAYQEDFDMVVLFDDKESTVQSTLDVKRLGHMARLGNLVLNVGKEDSDYLLWIESDLIIKDRNLISGLCEGFNINHNAGIIAPMAMLDRILYDIWAFRDLDGYNWQWKHPFCRDYLKYDRYVPMLSVGTTTLIKSYLIDMGVGFGEREHFLELCKRVRSLEHNIFVDKKLQIFHPSKGGLVKGRWI